MRIVWAEETKADFRRLHEFLYKKNPNAAIKAAQTIRKQSAILSDNPEAGTSLGDEMARRELYIRFGKNGYILRYIPNYDLNVIQILRVWHTREDRQ